MKNDDQWFLPGDKVMLVAKRLGENTIKAPSGMIPDYGAVLCVADFYEGPLFNAVIFVGSTGWGYTESGIKIGWRASNFRKVEEIKLCVAAANHAKQPQPTSA